MVSSENQYRAPFSQLSLSEKYGQGEPWGLHGFFSTFDIACSALRHGSPYNMVLPQTETISSNLLFNLWFYTYLWTGICWLFCYCMFLHVIYLLISQMTLATRSRVWTVELAQTQALHSAVSARWITLGCNVKHWQVIFWMKSRTFFCG